MPDFRHRAERPIKTHKICTTQAIRRIKAFDCLPFAQRKALIFRNNAVFHRKRNYIRKKLESKLIFVQLKNMPGFAEFSAVFFSGRQGRKAEFVNSVLVLQNADVLINCLNFA